MLIAALLACDPASSPTTPADADSDLDTGGCAGTESELVAFVEARDTTGAACDPCSVGDLTFVGGFRNPCPEVAIDLAYDSTCFVAYHELTDPAGHVDSAGLDSCFPNATVSIPPGGIYEEPVTTASLTDVGTYRIDATFSTSPQRTATLTFAVQ